jgi:hypothetical protein
VWRLGMIIYILLLYINGIMKGATPLWVMAPLEAVASLLAPFMAPLLSH